LFRYKVEEDGKLSVSPPSGNDSNVTVTQIALLHGICKDCEVTGSMLASSPASLAVTPSSMRFRPPKRMPSGGVGGGGDDMVVSTPTKASSISSSSENNQKQEQQQQQQPQQQQKYDTVTTGKIDDVFYAMSIFTPDLEDSTLSAVFCRDDILLMLVQRTGSKQRADPSILVPLENLAILSTMHGQGKDCMIGLKNVLLLENE
jgi:hypothetical protein